jgi:hypothetical protein
VLPTSWVIASFVMTVFWIDLQVNGWAVEAFWLVVHLLRRGTSLSLGFFFKLFLSGTKLVDYGLVTESMSNISVN